MTVPEIKTRSAHWGWTEHQYFGYAVFGELTGHETLTGLLALSVLGRRLAPEECAILDDAAACLTLADPRIWPLKLTRLVASYGSPLAGAAAGLLTQEEARIGPWTVTKAAEILLLFRKQLDEAGPCNTSTGGATDGLQPIVNAYMANHNFIWGFGTPFRGHDERLVAYRACLKRRERTNLPYFRLFEALSEIVLRTRTVQPNIAMALAATLLDLGLSLSEIGPLCTSLTQHMFFAHGVAGTHEQPEVLQTLPTECVVFEGREPRQSPRAIHEGGP